jgi:ornithine carbamoyltransferase
VLRHFISQKDLSPDEIRTVFERTKLMKPVRSSSELQSKSLVMFFEKASTRTRLSFEIGMTQLGGHAVYVDQRSSQMARGESIADTARVASRYADLIMARVNKHETVNELAAWSSVPVINGLSDEEHPCQSLTDMYTILEVKGRLEGLQVACVGDGLNNVTHSLLLGCAQMGMHVRVGCPVKFAPLPAYVDAACAIAATTGSKIEILEDPQESVRGADVLYTDVWVSMGRESDATARLASLRPYQVNEALVRHAAEDYIFMHCLPAHIGEEVTADVAYGSHSVIFEEAENRLHVQKALMVFLDEAATGGQNENRAS